MTLPMRSRQPEEGRESGGDRCEVKESDDDHHGVKESDGYRCEVKESDDDHHGVKESDDDRCEAKESDGMTKW